MAANRSIVEAPASRGGKVDPARLGDEPRRAQNRVREQHRRRGDARDAVDLAFGVRPGALAQRAVERDLDAGTHVVAGELHEVAFQVHVVAAERGDRLDVPRQRDAGQPALEIEAGENVEGLARIADRLDHVPRVPGIADERVAAVEGHRGRVALRRSEPVGARIDLGEAVFEKESLDVGAAGPRPRLLARERLGARGERHERDAHEEARALHDRLSPGRAR